MVFCRTVVIVRVASKIGSPTVGFGVIGCRSLQYESLHLLVSESELPTTLTTYYEERAKKQGSRRPAIRAGCRHQWEQEGNEWTLVSRKDKIMFGMYTYSFNWLEIISCLLTLWIFKLNTFFLSTNLGTMFLNSNGTRLIWQWSSQSLTKIYINTRAIH